MASQSQLRLTAADLINLTLVLLNLNPKAMILVYPILSQPAPRHGLKLRGQIEDPEPTHLKVMNTLVNVPRATPRRPRLTTMQLQK